MLMKYDKNETTKYCVCGEAEPFISSVLQVKGVFVFYLLILRNLAWKCRILSFLGSLDLAGMVNSVIRAGSLKLFWKCEVVIAAY